MTLSNLQEYVPPLLSHLVSVCLIGRSPRLNVQVGVYFTEVELSGSPNKYVPRSVQIDLEEGVCDRVSELRTGPLS